MAGQNMAGAMQPIQPMQDLRGNAAINDIISALNPQEMALLAQGQDPFGGDQGMLGGQPGMPAAAPGNAQVQALQAQQVVENLYNALAGINPTDETSALAASSIQTAIDALTGGLQK